ncbi:MAG: hypothetical protein ACK2UU_04370 [Anaerolineae bacterium]|jgi:hypothetical protein
MVTRHTPLPGNTNLAEPSAVNGRDISGYALFSQGPSGEAHALAHRLTDTAQWRLGHRMLKQWLDTHSGQGSDWVHLQFHMAIFELALGEWDAAHRRFLSEVLPTAANTAKALTDAPALLWRLALSAPETILLPWEPIRRTALAHMHDTPDPFVQLHHLLALAGANDTSGIALWLRTAARFAGTQQQRALERFALAMAALSSAAFRRAADLLYAVLPELPAIGGSQAQNQLFGQLAAWAARQAASATLMPAYRQAA